jgi:cytochrome P450
LSDAVVDLDAGQPAFKNDPYPVYAELRRSGPVRRITLNGLPAWLVLGYDNVRQALADPGLSNSLDNLNPAVAEAGPWVLSERVMGLDRNLMRSDPPAHARLRRLVSKAFTVGRIEALRPRVQDIAGELVADFLPRGEAELIGDFAFPLPLMVIMELLGMPLAERAPFRRWAEMTVPRAGGEAEVMEGYAAIRAYFVELVERKTRDSGGEDLLSALVRVRDEGQRLSEDELLGMAWLLFAAGHTTVADLVGSGTLALLSDPKRYAALRADPGLLPAAIEEMLRYDGPVELGISRFTTAPVTIGEVTIPGDGQVVFLAFAAADRDPARFPDPDRFDPDRFGPDRDQPGHIAFGHGMHFCLGAPLARMEAAVAFGTLLHRCPDLELATLPDRIPWRAHPQLRGPTELPVRFTPQSR